MTAIQKVGSLGENIVKNFLISKKYKILLRQYKIRQGEIDIICRDNKYLVFVEVKTRTAKNFGTPEEAFAYKKRQCLLTAIYRYLQEQNYNGPWRVDLVCLQINRLTKRAQLRHYKFVEMEDIKTL